MPSCPLPRKPRLTFCHVLWSRAWGRFTFCKMLTSRFPPGGRFSWPEAAAASTPVQCSRSGLAYRSSASSPSPPLVCEWPWPPKQTGALGSSLPRVSMLTVGMDSGHRVCIEGARPTLCLWLPLPLSPGRSEFPSCPPSPLRTPWRAPVHSPASTVAALCWKSCKDRPAP